MYLGYIYRRKKLDILPEVVNSAELSRAPTAKEELNHLNRPPPIPPFTNVLSGNLVLVALCFSNLMFDVPTISNPLL